MFQSFSKLLTVISILVYCKSFKLWIDPFKRHTLTNMEFCRSCSEKELKISTSRFVQNSFEVEGSTSPCRIKVIGVGGGGGNAVNRMLKSATDVLGVELWAVNTDAQALSRNLAPNKLNIGVSASR